MPNKPLLICDLDETLIHAKLWGGWPHREPDFKVCNGDFEVVKRPHIQRLLDSVRDDWKLAVWTSASGDYAEEIVANVFRDIPLQFLFARERCTPRHYRRYSMGWYDPVPSSEPDWIKDLKKSKRRGFPLERTLLIDDSPEKAQRQYGNLIKIDPFFGSEDDFLLETLSLYLPTLLPQPNFRTVDKRYWISQTLSKEGTE